MTTMQAVQQVGFGSAAVLALATVPRPQPGPGELLVRVRAAGVNPVDWKIREGYLRDFFDFRPPFIPGFDLSGIVEGVGPGVTAFEPGEEVFAFLPLARPGALAEYAVVKVEEAAAKPQTLTHTEAAGVPLAALTAWQALFDIASLGRGQSVLIHAAAGGVGHFATQLANWAGAHVIGTASAGNLDFLRQHGVHQGVDYTAGPFEEQVPAVDVVLDTLSGDTRERSWRLVKPHGILVSTLPPPPVVPAGAAAGVRGMHMLVRPSGAQLGRLADLIDSRVVRPEVTVLPFVQIHQAQALSQSGHTRGKIVLAIGEP
ncbi:MAG: NADP-dependent oxidoreductase [Thermodesulfobacteriota bacterium]